MSDIPTNGPHDLPHDGPYDGPYESPTTPFDDDVDLRSPGTRVRWRGPRRRTLAIVAAVLALPLLAVLVGSSWYRGELGGTDGGAPVSFGIESGWGVSRIGDELVAADVIDNKLAFTIYTRFGDHTEFQAGEYELTEGMGIRDAIDALEAGPVVRERELRVIPGLWLDEIAAEVEQQLGLDAATFVDVVRGGTVRSRYQPEGIVSAEGLLFPDTYRVADDATEIDVAEMMVARFDEVATDLGLADAAAITGRSPYEVAVVASLVQGEARLDADRPVIASVIYNRLAQEMKLQIDATVLYAIGERKPTNTDADRATPSPYNTYYADGLPPTPIATIARVSLEAALRPATTEYLYYVLADAEGGHAFAVTYEEHLANVERARELGLFG